MTPSFFSITIKSRGAHPNEDAASVNAARTVFAVADGVTRTPKAPNAYPNPSPAAMAATTFCDVVQQELGQDGLSVGAIMGAFRRANQSIGELNRLLGLDKSLDYFTQDLAGTVAAVIVKDGLTVAYAYVGDCGVAILDKAGGIKMQTPDDVKYARADFPVDQTMSGRKRLITIRSEYRNKPTSAHKTYGVLTGEKAALSYVRTGSAALQSTDTIVVFTDGALPLLQSNMGRSLIMDIDEPGVERLIYRMRRENHQSVTGDITLIAARAV